VESQCGEAVSSKERRAYNDGLSDGYAGAEDDSCCRWYAEACVASYSKGRAEGYAKYLANRQAEKQAAEDRFVLIEAGYESAND
jgi:hypothetical protein